MPASKIIINLIDPLIIMEYYGFRKRTNTNGK
jgi:hypothetical protein